MNGRAFLSPFEGHIDLSDASIPSSVVMESTTGSMSGAWLGPGSQETCAVLPMAKMPTNGPGSSPGTAHATKTIYAVAALSKSSESSEDQLM